jgi:zinc protease
LNILEKDLEAGLDIFADCLLRPVFPLDRLDLVQMKTISEIRSQEDNLLSLGRTVLDKTMFRTHPYRLPVLGTEKTVKKITPDDLFSLHRKVVVPDNTHLAVFGNIDRKKIIDLVEKKFSDFPAKTFQTPMIEQEKGAAEVRRGSMVLDKKQTVVLLGFNGPSIKHRDRWGLTILTEILSGLGSRLFQRIRSSMGLAYYVGSFMMSGIEQGSYIFYCGTIPDKAKVARDALLEEIRKIKENGVTEEEMKLARENMIGKKMLDRQRLSNLAAEVVIDELFGLGVDYHRKFNSLVEAVAGEEVCRVANRYFTEDDYAEVFVGGKVV